MAKLSKEDFLAAVKSIVGERTDDEALAFLENMSDTYNELSGNSGEDWEAKYKENDNQWRERYRARFFSGVQPGDDEFMQKQNATKEPAEPQANDPKPEENIGFDDLFTSEV